MEGDDLGAALCPSLLGGRGYVFNVDGPGRPRRRLPRGRETPHPGGLLEVGFVGLGFSPPGPYPLDHVRRGIASEDLDDQLVHGWLR